MATGEHWASLGPCPTTQRVTLTKTVLIAKIKTVVLKLRILWHLFDTQAKLLVGHLLSVWRDWTTHSFRWVQKIYLTDLPEMGLLKAIELLFCFLVSPLKWPSWNKILAAIKFSKHEKVFCVLFFKTFQATSPCYLTQQPHLHLRSCSITLMPKGIMPRLLPLLWSWILLFLISTYIITFIYTYNI